MIKNNESKVKITNRNINSIKSHLNEYEFIEILKDKNNIINNII